MTRLSGGSQDRIHAKVHVRHHIAQQDDNHEFAGIGQRHVAGSEEAQNGVEEQQTDDHEQESHNEIQRHRIAQQLLGTLIVVLTQFHTDTRRRTHAHSSSECRTEVHEGKRNAQAGNGIRPDHLSDEGAVDDVI